MVWGKAAAVGVANGTGLGMVKPSDPQVHQLASGDEVLEDGHVRPRAFRESDQIQVAEVVVRLGRRHRCQIDGIYDIKKR